MLVIIALALVFACGRFIKPLTAELIGLQALQLSPLASSLDASRVTGDRAPAMKLQALLQRVSIVPGPATRSRPATTQAQTRPTWPPPEVLAALRSLTDRAVWEADAATAAPAVERVEAQWRRTGIDPVVKAIAAELPPVAADPLRRCRFTWIDPALAAFWGQQAVIPARARQLQQTTHDLTRLARSCVAAGNRDAAVLAYAVAIVALQECAATSQYTPLVLLAAQDLPRTCRGLATVADAQGNVRWAAEFRAAAGQWDRLYTTWRQGASDAPNLLPNTGTAVYYPAAHRSALLSLTQAGVTLVVLCVYAVILIGATLARTAAALLRRPAAPLVWASASGGASSAVALVVPTLLAWGLLSLAGDDWSWLTSAQLVVAVVLLVTLAHVTVAPLAARQLLRGEGETRSRQADWLAAGGKVLCLMLATTAAVLLVLKQSDQRRDMVPPPVDFAIALAWFWLCLVLLFAAMGWIGRLIRWLLAATRRSNGASTPQARKPKPAFGNALFTMAALGFFVHALLLPPMLYRNEQRFCAHSQKVAHTLADEPAARLGPDWRVRYNPEPDRLLAPLREHR